jgi:hypothetical protein
MFKDFSAAIIRLLFSIIIIVVPFIATAPVYAASRTPNPSSSLTGEITNPVLSEDLNSLTGAEYTEGLIQVLVTIAFVVGAIVFFFMFVIGAIRWITSSGDKASVESARGMIITAIVGFVILVSTFAIVSLIENIFGIDILSIDISPLFI